MLKILKIKFKKRRVKSKCSIDKKIKILPILYQFHHKNLYVDMYFYLSAIIFRKKFAIVNLFLISRRNHSSLINNIVTKKIKYFPQLFAFMPQIEDGDGTNMKILSCFDESLPPNQIYMSTKLDIYKYKDDYIFKGLLRVICSVKITIWFTFLARNKPPT